MKPLVTQIPSRHSLMHLLPIPVWLALAGLLLPTAARAQVSYTGPVAIQNFGAQPAGSAGAAQAFSFSIAAGTKVGSIAVVTTGLANMDFANAPGSTCTPQSYSSAASCTVNVTFTPMAAGLRMGAVVFFSNAKNTGTVLGSVLVYGTGMGPQIAFSPGTPSVIDRSMYNIMGLADPVAVTADAAGDLYVLDTLGNPTSYRLVKLPANGGTATAIDPAVDGDALFLPSCVAVDGAGDLFIGDFYGRIMEVPVGGGAATSFAPVVNGVPLNYPSGLAVDGSGDLFIGDYINNRVLEVPAAGGATLAIDPTVNGIPLDDPHGLALDAAGDLFIADLGNGRVVELPAGGGAATAIAPTANGEGLQNPEAVAVDAAGNLFIADNVNHRVVEVPVAGGAATAIDPVLYFAGMGVVSSVAVDWAGNLFIVQSGLQSGSNILEEVEHAQPPALTFPTATYTGSTDSVDGAMAAQLMNIGNEPFVLTAIDFPADFSPASGDSNACAAATILNPGQECDVSVDFTPQNGGALSESVTLIDNALNAPTAQQSITVKATGEVQTTLTSPAPGSTLAGPSVAFTWTATAGATNYCLSLGSTGVGSSNLYVSGKVTSTSMTATGLPSNGEPVYVRLITYFNLIQMHVDYTYTASTQAQLTAPALGAVLPGSSATFAWTTGSAATGYLLWLGSTGVGSSNLYTLGQTTATSIAVSGLPTNGETIYARLMTNLNGVMAHTDYTFTAATQVALTSPAPGAVLSNPTVIFKWTSATGATGYRLLVGSIQPGSSNLYDSGQKLATAATATILPPQGATIYARLVSNIKGVERHSDYTYTNAVPTKPAALVSPAPGSTLAGSSVTFKWSAGFGVTHYQLLLGTNGAGTSGLYNSGVTTATSATVTSLPLYGVKVYARLFSQIGGVWQYVNCTYSEAGTPASLISPVPGSRLAAPSATFTWGRGFGNTSYQLLLGTNGPGTSSLYNSGVTTKNSVTVANLPAYGVKVYARLFSQSGGVWQHVDYTFTEK